jgi:hypothetical protein
MNPRFPVREVMKRTMANLEFIERHATIRGPFDTTQLINSFLGAFVHVKERFDQYIPKTALPVAGWPVITTLAPHKPPKHLRQLVRRVRNGIAHGNIKLVAGDRNIIASIQLWNIPSGSKKRDWETEIGIQQLHELLDCFFEMMSPILKQHEKRSE